MTSFRLFAVLSLFSFIDTCTEADRRPATANPPECTEFRKHRTVTGLWPHTGRALHVDL